MENDNVFSGMLRVFFWVILVFLKNGFTIEDDNLRNALDSIENRQKQLTSNYNLLQNKDGEQSMQFNDGNLMYLDSSSPDFGTAYDSALRFGFYVLFITSLHIHSFSQLVEGFSISIFIDSVILRQKVDQNWSFFVPTDSNYNLLETGHFFELYRSRRIRVFPLTKFFSNARNEICECSSSTTRHRVSGHYLNLFLPQKKSFFRERETNEVSENLQNLYPDDNSDENEFLVPSSFRERIKSKLHSNPHRRIVQPYETEDLDDNDDDYLNVLSPLWHKYEEFHENDFNPELYLIEAKERDRSKRYWQGSDDSSVVKYSIQKRSAGFEQKPTTEKIVVTKTNLTQTEKVKSGLEITSAMPQKSEISEIKTSISKKGQKEVPINLKSSKPLNIKKKSIDWSEYFGVDKRQKKSNTPSKELHKNNALQDQFIQSHILQSSKNSAFNNYGKNYRYFPKRESPETQYVGDIGSKLKIAEDLKTAENLIIDHVLKYTGAHEGVTNPKELKGFREKVINELAAAYNLEKLRNELLDNSRQWFTDRTKKQHQHFDNKNKVRYFILKKIVYIFACELKLKNMYSALSKQFFKLKRRCFRFFANEKDFDSTFTPFCALHHICVICGTKDEVLSCDLSFYSDVNAICGGEPVCQYTAQRILRAMQTSRLKSYVSTNTCSSCIAEILQYSLEK
ncbi:hypothetical protein PGB90_007111 [Kerria lacca]